MFDIKKIEENPLWFDEGWGKRGLTPRAKDIIALQEERKRCVAKAQDAREKRNELSSTIRLAKKNKDEEAVTRLTQEVMVLKDVIQAAESRQATVEQQLQDILHQLPNIPLEDVPFGADDKDNKPVALWGQKPRFDFVPKHHFDLGEALGLMDFDTAAKISGARFVILKGQLSVLERALAHFMLDIHTKEFGYEEITPPLLVKSHAMVGTAQLPKFAFDQFSTQNDMWLIPTAEVPLTNIMRETIVEEKDLPKRVTAYSPCFRLEAGASGKDTRGMIRNHQFSEVELVSVTTQEQALAEHERMLKCAQTILERLGLHYRTLLLCTGDMGFSARKTYDLEVWLPPSDTFREISSCSVCGDFQARRMMSRYRTSTGAVAFTHTLNGSGLAVGRTLVAVMENYQQEDGSILIPDVLQPYTHFDRIIKR